VHETSASVAHAARALADPHTTVLARPAVLVQAGPGWFARVREAATPTAGPPPPIREVGVDPRRWPAWWWAMLVGLCMIVAGLGAAAITLGPVLLWYDHDLLGMDVDHLHGQRPSRGLPAARPDHDGRRDGRDRRALYGPGRGWYAAGLALGA
jgi:hypothetical protein